MPATARAGLTVARIFGHGMVLQRGQPIPVRGAGARPGSRVTVELRDGGAAGALLATASADAGGGGAWRVPLPAIAGARTKPLTMLVSDGAERLEFDGVLVGDVWLCSGQSNMNLSVAHNDDLDATRPWSARVDGSWVQPDPAPELDAGIRHFGVEQVLAENHGAPQTDLPAPTKGEGVWRHPTVPEAGRFTAAGFYFARAWRAAKLRAGEDVPVGIVRVSWGGTPIESWMSGELLGSRPDFAERREALKNMKGAANPPSRCYNSLLHPLLGFPVRGFIWYQGESNAGAHAVYRAQLIALIKDWRAGWGLPSAAFIVVQLPSMPRNSAHGEDARQWMRVSQAELVACADRPGARVLLAAYPDLGANEPTPRNTDMEVHARRKRDLGERIALLVRRELDGEALLARGPVPADGSAGRDTVTLRMDAAGAGLGTLDGQPLRGFEMAGADGVYHPARAVIDGDSVRLTSDAVKKPVSARYAWSNALHAPGERTGGKPFPPAGNLSTRDYAEKGAITGKTYRLAASSFRWETVRGGGSLDKVRDGSLIDEFDTT
ncbi:MAG: sialate O-acetylesterase, partial [Opitutaceae bacterium]|nr:sialate O-acetylesterase [Opitutaceae bacterium]